MALNYISLCWINFTETPIYYIPFCIIYRKNMFSNQIGRQLALITVQLQKVIRCCVLAPLKVCLLCVCVCPPQVVTGPDGGHEGSQPSGWTSCKEEEAETRKRCPIRYECFAAVSSFSWSFLCSLSSPVCVFSFCVSPAAVCEADEVSSPKGVHLNAAAASPLHWYDCLLILTCYTCVY